MIDSRRLAPPLLFASALQALGYGMVLLLLPIDGLTSGGIFGGFALPGMVSVGSASVPIVGAILIERAGHKRMMLTGLALASLGGLAIATSDTSLLRAPGALAYGVGLGLFRLSRVTYLSDAVMPDQRGRIVSAVGGMGRIGLFAGPALAGFISTVQGRDSALFYVAALSASAAVVILAVPACATLPASVPRSHPLAFIHRVFREHRSTFGRVGLSMLALAFVRSGRMLLIPICGTILGLDESSVGLAKSASMGADMLLFYPAGLVMDRFGRKWTGVPCLSVLSLGVLVVGMASSPAWFLFGAVIAGIGNGLGAGINMTLAGDFSPREGRAEFLGVWTLMTEVGSVTSPFATGTIAAVLALGPAAAVVTSVGLAAAGYMALGVREPLEHARERQLSS